jgi:Fe2+ or Zn2+ uptake regulation protein
MLCYNVAFFICRKCGASAEIEDARIEHQLAEHAAALGYRATRRVIEVEGVCPSCIAAESPEAGSNVVRIAGGLS